MKEGDNVLWQTKETVTEVVGKHQRCFRAPPECHVLDIVLIWNVGLYIMTTPALLQFLTAAKIDRTLLNVQGIQHKVHVALDDNGSANAERNRAVHVQAQTRDLFE